MRQLLHHPTTVTRDLEFFLRGNNPNLFRGEAETFKTYGGRGTNVLAVLTNTSGENKKINSAEKRGIRSDHFAHRDCENIEGELGHRIIVPGPRFERFYIALSA